MAEMSAENAYEASSSIVAVSVSQPPRRNPTVDESAGPDGEPGSAWQPAQSCCSSAAPCPLSDCGCSIAKQTRDKTAKKCFMRKILFVCLAGVGIFWNPQLLSI